MRRKIKWIALGFILGAVSVVASQPEPEPLHNQVRAIASKVRDMEGELKDMAIVKELARAIAGQAPRGSAPVQPSETLDEVLKMGIRLERDSCLWRLTEVVKDCLVKGETTPADQALIDKLREECHAGL